MITLIIRNILFLNCYYAFPTKKPGLLSHFLLFKLRTGLITFLNSNAIFDYHLPISLSPHLPISPPPIKRIYSKLFKIWYYAFPTKKPGLLSHFLLFKLRNFLHQPGFCVSPDYTTFVEINRHPQLYNNYATEFDIIGYSSGSILLPLYIESA